jgi:hypothetical protein
MNGHRAELTGWIQKKCNRGEGDAWTSTGEVAYPEADAGL